jgi:S-adenosylmethionine:tRNA ribosyltransferase-isomerase
LKKSDYLTTNIPYLKKELQNSPWKKGTESKLIQFKNNQISHHRFFELPDLIPSGSMMVFNNTKVIPARLIFQRESGAKIEIFLLKPIFAKFSY